MSKYTKPTVSFISLNANSASTSSCSTSTTDAKEIKEILISMGYDINNAFGAFEECAEPVMFEDYCKFSSSIQVFFS